MGNFRRNGFAVVIESKIDLADTLCDHLTLIGYHVSSQRTHAAAAEFALGKEVDLLAACVPDIQEDRASTYLQEAIRRNSKMSVVLMLIDKLEPFENAPYQAAMIVKPFDRDMLIAAILVSEGLTRMKSEALAPGTGSKS